MDPQSVLTQFAPALARVVASYERDRALRDELLQEVFMAVLSSLPRLADPEKLKPFVFRVAHNRCISHVAKRMRERVDQVPIDELAADLASHEQALIEQELIEQERGERLLSAVRRLPLPHRQVMTLLLEDMTYDEIAETLGITVANVGIRVNRAKQQLKAVLHDE